MKRYEAPAAPVGGLGWALSKMADEDEFCCCVYVIVADISMICVHKLSVEGCETSSHYFVNHCIPNSKQSINQTNSTIDYSSSE